MPVRDKRDTSKHDALPRQGTSPAWVQNDTAPDKKGASLNEMMSFVSVPIRWTFDDAQQIQEGRFPIERNQQRLIPFWQHLKHMKTLLISGSIALLLVFTLIGFGIKQGLKQAPEPLQQALGFLATGSTFAKQSPETRAEEAEAPNFQKANAAIDKAMPSPFKELPFREDPFHPLISLEWWQRLIDTNAEEIQNNRSVPSPEQYTNTDSPSVGYLPDSTTPKTEVTPFPSQPTVPLIPHPALEFVGIVADANNSNKATVLLRSSQNGTGIMLSKQIGETFTVDGQKITLRSLTKGRLNMNVNGLSQHLNMANSGVHPTASGVPPRKQGPASDDDIDKILDELGNMR